MNAQSLPPAPAPGQPVTVPMDILPEWLEHHNLSIIGFDERGRYYVAPKVAPGLSSLPSDEK